MMGGSHERRDLVHGDHDGRSRGGELATAVLMEVLHTRLASGDRPAFALRAAQLTMLRSRTDRASSHFWSAFHVEEW